MTQYFAVWRVLHFFGSGNTKKPQPAFDHVSDRFGESKTRIACGCIVNENTMIDVETIELFGKVNDMASYVTRFAKFAARRTESPKVMTDLMTS